VSERDAIRFIIAAMRSPWAPDFLRESADGVEAALAMPEPVAPPAPTPAPCHCTHEIGDSPCPLHGMDEPDPPPPLPPKPWKVIHRKPKVEPGEPCPECGGKGRVNCSELCADPLCVTCGICCGRGRVPGKESDR
jgi:hypothetical protein